MMLLSLWTAVAHVPQLLFNSFSSAFSPFLHLIPVLQETGDGFKAKAWMTQAFKLTDCVLECCRGVCTCRYCDGERKWKTARAVEHVWPTGIFAVSTFSHKSLSF